MRITIDTEGQETASTAGASAKVTSPASALDGGGAPAAMQPYMDPAGGDFAGTTTNAGPPSAELMAAIMAASSSSLSGRMLDGGVARN
jgi:hypothetical protein